MEIKIITHDAGSNKNNSTSTQLITHSSLLRKRPFRRSRALADVKAAMT